MGSKAKCSLCGAILLTTIILIACSLQKVSSTEVGVVYDAVWGVLHDDILTEGLHTKPPFGDIILWPSIYSYMEFSEAKGTQITCNSKDGVAIGVDASFQFVPRKKDVFELTNTYQDFDTYYEVVRITARSALRDGCGNFTSIEFQTKRSDVQLTMDSYLTGEVGKIFSDVVDMQLRNIERPVLFEVAVQNKEAQRTDIDLAENERNQKKTEAEANKNEALQDAIKTLTAAYTFGNVTKEFAENNARGRQFQYERYAEIFAIAKTRNQFDEAGILAYIGNTFLGTKGNAHVAVSLPSRLSYMEEKTCEAPTAAPTN